ncbi:hypothetical protein QN226_30970, partial [Sinorhizobium sp. 6-117]|nr:hypothetical protein [Sinorhizobium sp. 6-117]
VEPAASSTVETVIGDVVVRVACDIESDYVAKIRLRVVRAGRLPQGCGILDGSGQRWRSRPIQRSALCDPIEAGGPTSHRLWDGSGVCLSI